MSSMEKTLSSWRKLILAGEFEHIHDILKSEYLKKKWTAKEEDYIATYCLVVVNMKAHEALKSNSQFHNTLEMFALSELCCSIIKKTWICDGVKFLGSVYNICRYFLSQENFHQAIVISQYATEYVNIRNIDLLSEEEKRSIKAILFLYLKYLSSVQLTANNKETIMKIWKFILSSPGYCKNDSTTSAILETFQHFYYKMFTTTKHLESNVLLIYLSEMEFGNISDSSFNILIAIFRLCINYMLTSDVRKKFTLIIRCMKNASNSSPPSYHLVYQFLCDILCFSICDVDQSVSSDFISKCIDRLKEISNLPQPCINQALYTACVILVHLRHQWMDEEHFFYENCTENIFEFFVLLAKKIHSLDPKETVGTKISSQDCNYSIYVANFVLILAYRVHNEDTARLSYLHSYIRSAMEIAIQVYEPDFEIDEKRKSHLYYLIGASCVNICRSYMKADLYRETKDFCLAIVEKIVALPSVSDASLIVCIEKLIIILYNSFKYLGQFEEALKTACIWAVKLPNCEKTFMDLFASLKAKMLSNQQQQYLCITCWDVLKGNTTETHFNWENVNLQSYNIISLLKSELTSYMKYHVYSIPLIEKIIDIIKSQKDTMIKVEFYILAGLMYTHSNDSLDNALELIPALESFIDVITRRSKTKCSKETKIFYSLVLGNLYYTKFRIRLLETRCIKEKETVVFNKLKAPTSSLELGMEQEPLDVSDIIHKYLTYQSQQEIIAMLDNALQYWQRTVVDVENSSCEKFSEISKNSNISVYIRETALMYRLYCHETKESNAWKLLHSLAIIWKDDDLALYAFSNLLSLPNCGDLEWKTEAESKLNNVNRTTKIRYQLEIAAKLLNDGHAAEGVSVLSDIPEGDVKNLELLWAKYNFIVSQYELAGSRQTTHGPLLTAFKAYFHLVSRIKHSSWMSFHEAYEMQNLLLEVSLFISNLFLNMYQINEAKCYLKEQVNVIQKLCLPLKICQYLIALCQASVISCDIEDIYAKLNALKEVLKFNDQNQKILGKPIPKIGIAVSPEFSLNSDVRFASNFSSNNFYSSPVLESSLKYEMPDFLYHEMNCSCALCNDAQYQIISCEVMSLFGMYFYRAGKRGQASHHFETASEMMRIIDDRCARMEHKRRLLKMRIVGNIRQGDFWASCGDFKKAEMFNKAATSYYEQLIIPDQAAYKELRDQHYALMGVKEEITEAQPKKKTRQKQPVVLSTAKTPAKSSVAVFEDDEDDKISSLIKKMQITPYPKHSRRVLFEDNQTFATPCKPPPTVRASRTAKKRNEDTPPDIVMQTPSSLIRSRKIVKETEIPAEVKTYGKRIASTSKTNKNSLQSKTTLENSIELKTRLRSRNK